MLKNLLALLLSKFYSKKESSLVAKQSYPSTATTTISLTPSDGSTNKEISYTPPNDGYIVLRDQGLPQSSSYLITGQYAEGVARGDNILFDFLMMTPVLKGVPVTIRYCGKDSLAQFIKNIGGGGRSILLSSDEGGKLCLKSLSPCSQRSFCKAKNNGSAVKPSLIQELNSVTQQEGMSLQRTDTSVSSIQEAQEAVCFLTSTQERIQMCYRQIVVSETVGCLLRTLTWGLLSLLKKECQSILRRIQSQSRFGSAQLLVGANFRTGGSLC